MEDTRIKDYFKSKDQEEIHMSDYFYPGTLTNNKILLNVVDDSILNPYDNLLNRYKKIYTFTNEEFRKYKFNPWKVAYDVYGYTELWFLLLHANEMYSADEFNRQTIYLYTKSVLNVLSEIIAISDNEKREIAGKVEKYKDDLEFQLQSETNRIYRTQIIDSFIF